MGFQFMSEPMHPLLQNSAKAVFEVLQCGSLTVRRATRSRVLREFFQFFQPVHSVSFFSFFSLLKPTSRENALHAPQSCETTKDPRPMQPPRPTRHSANARGKRLARPTLPRPQRSLSNFIMNIILLNRFTTLDEIRRNQLKSFEIKSGAKSWKIC